MSPCPLADNGNLSHNFRDIMPIPGKIVLYCSQCGEARPLNWSQSPPASTSAQTTPKAQPVVSHDPLAGLNP